jgi:hypothetical protein
MDRSDRNLTLINPVDRAALARLPLAAAERELLDGIVREPRLERRRSRRPAALAVVVVGVAAAVLLAVGAAGRGRTPTQAYGVELMRLARRSPIVVVAPPRHAPRRVPGHAHRGMHVYDCTHLPCVERTYVDAVKRGLVEPSRGLDRLPRGVKLVIAPRQIR